MRPHTYTTNRDYEADEAEPEIVVEYTYSPGCAAQTYGDPLDCWPAEGPEIEIISVWLADSKAPVTLTDAEREHIIDRIAVDHDDGPDDSDC